MLLYITVLFVALVPGILITIPPKGSRLVIAITHALLFALLLHLTYKRVWGFMMENFTNGPIPDCSTASPTKFCTCPAGYMYLVDNNTCIPSVEQFDDYMPKETQYYQRDTPFCDKKNSTNCIPHTTSSDDGSVF
jgi:hypothetical protein